MCDEPIVRRRYIRKLAHAAFRAGEGRDAHGMNPWTSAAQTFQLRYDRLAKVREASRASHSAPAARTRIDVRQGGV